jgi:ribosomal protein L13
MKIEIQILVLIKDFIDSLCPSLYQAHSISRQSFSLHVSVKDDEWNRLAIEVARTLQLKEPCLYSHATLGSDAVVINLSDDNSKLNKYALALADRDRNKQQRNKLKKRSLTKS